VPYCPNCGKETSPDATYCASCGRPLWAPQPPPYVQSLSYSRKEEVIAVLLSLILPGTGQMYVGRIVRGIIIFFTPIILTFFVVIPIFLGSLFASIPSSVTPVAPPIPQPAFVFTFPIIFIVLGLFWLAFLIWNVLDAYNLARFYNQHLITTGRPPW